MSEVASRLLNRPMMIHKDDMYRLSSVAIDTSKVDASAMAKFNDLSTEVDMHLASSDVKSMLDSATIRKLSRGSIPVFIVGSTAVMRVSGVIWQELDFWTWLFYGGVSSIELGNKVNILADIEQIDGIILEWNSPGGEAPGSETAAIAVKNAAEHKPVVSICANKCASAAYQIASGSTKILLPESTSIVGSVGCCYTHIDVSKRNEGRGIVITEIAKGDLKMAGSSNRPLDEKGEQELVRFVGAFYSSFLDLVSQYRGLNRKDIESTIGRSQVFMGQQAINIGLADDFGGLSAAIDIIKEHTNMANDNEPRVLSREEIIASLTVDELKSHNVGLFDKIKQEGVTEGTKTGQETGASAERERVSGIMSIANSSNIEIVKAAVENESMDKGDVAVKIIESQGDTGQIDPKAESPKALKSIETPNKTPDQEEKDEIESLLAGV